MVYILIEYIDGYICIYKYIYGACTTDERSIERPIDRSNDPSIDRGGCAYIVDARFLSGPPDES